MDTFTVKNIETGLFFLEWKTRGVPHFAYTDDPQQYYTDKVVAKAVLDEQIHFHPELDGLLSVVGEGTHNSCENCDRVFVVVRNNQRFCSTNCRVRWHRKEKSRQIDDLKRQLEESRKSNRNK